MSPLMLLGLVVALGLIAWFSARARALAFASGPTARARAHSVPGYHGWYVALWAIVPALLFFAVWQLIEPTLVTNAVLHGPIAAQLPADAMERASVLEEARALSAHEIEAGFNPLSSRLAPAFDEAGSRYALFGTGLTLLLCFAGGAFAFLRLRPNLRARTKVERLVMLILLLASLMAILTTVGIVFSLLFDALRFF